MDDTEIKIKFAEINSKLEETKETLCDNRTQMKLIRYQVGSLILIVKWLGAILGALTITEIATVLRGTR